MITTEGIPGIAPLSKLRESPLNPRKHYDEGELRQLAASLTECGCLQPVVVRPMPADATLVSGEKTDLKHFEIVAGHRRYRAAKLARLKDLPILIHRLTDDQVREIMLVENTQRVDLRPSEEAASLAELVAKCGVEKAAEKVGKPESTVRERAALATLPAWFLAAVDAGLVPVSTAVVVARVPGVESREKAAVCVAAGLQGPHSLDEYEDWRQFWFDHTGEDGPALNSDYTQVLSYRNAKQLVRTHFSRELGKAPFSKKALDLVPDAGSCEACPKRAGNDPALKAEGVRADVCTDPDCYERKVAAYRAAEVARFSRKWDIPGLEAIDDPWQGDRPPRGYCDLAAPIAGSELDNGLWGKKAGQMVADLLGQMAGWEKGLGRLLSFDAKGKPRTLVRTADLRKRLRGAGLMTTPEAEKRVPLGDEEVSLRVGSGKGEPTDVVRYRVVVDWDMVGPIEFDAPAGSAAGMQHLVADAVAAAVYANPSAVRHEPVPTETDSPPVHEPGNLALSKLPGLNPSDVQCLLACEFATLADLGRECGGDLDRVEEVLERFQGAFRPADVERVAGAVRAWLDTTPKAEARTPAPLTAAAYNARVAELRASSADWWRDEKAMAELAALWGRGCNTFGVFADAKEETVARSGKAVVKVMLATGECGLWLSSYTADAGTSGSSSSPSVTDTAYDTREAAREAALRKALAWCGSHRETSGVEKTKALAAKLADQLRVLLGEAPPKKAKRQTAQTLSN